MIEGRPPPDGTRASKITDKWQANTRTHAHGA